MATSGPVGAKGRSPTRRAVLRLFAAESRGFDDDGPCCWTPRRSRAADRLLELAERARLQGPPELVLIDRPFASALEQAPASTQLHVFALSSQTDFESLREIRERLDAPCIFVRDPGIENVFA